MREPYALEIEIIPAILEKEWKEIERKTQLVKSFAKILHIDVLDGKFAPNTTWMDPAAFAPYTKDTVFEAHLMVDNPVQYIKQFADAGFQRFIGHVEMMPSVEEFVAQAQLYGEVGLALNSETPLSKIPIPLETVEEDVDVLFLMTVKAGFSHQQFIPEVLEKARMIRQKNALIPIEIDGGVNSETIILAKKAGVTRFAVTSFLFDTPDPKERYEELLAECTKSGYLIQQAE